MIAYVEVNECKVLHTRSGVDWWVAFSQRFRETGRIEVVKASLGGALVRVACDDAGHARDLAEHMVAFGGLPKSAVKVRGVRAVKGGDAS